MLEEKSLIGKEILNYRIVRFIGKGGMGSVYEAVNQNFNQKVAIKVLNANVAESEFARQTFVREAQTLLTLNHQNIVKFLNFYENEDGVFLITEYVDGVTLDDFIKTKNGLIVESRAYELFSQILDAFAYAHKQGIVHRDIKPANIMLTGDNEGNFVVKVLDFGIARIVSESNESEKNLVIGTPAFMSPEQVRGENVDERSDVYSLGVLLHQMLTGRTPYDTTTLSETDIQKRVVEDQLPRMKEFYQGISDRIQKVVDKATAKKTAARYPNCAAFRKDFLPKAAMPLWQKIAAVAAIILLFGGGFGVWDYNRIKTYYYKEYVEQWGVPKGIGKADYKNRIESYRIEKQKGKVIRLSHVNCKGKISEHTDSEYTERPNDMLFFYNDNGKIDYVKILDRNGKVLYKKDYDENLKTVTFKYDDEFGTEMNIAGSTTVLFQNPFDSDNSKGKIYKWLLTYDENGYVQKEQYAGNHNVLVCDNDGLYGREYVRDSKGRAIEIHYLGFDGKPKANKYGLAIKKFEYDQNDNWTNVSYFSANGELSSDGNGCPVVVLDNDKYGNRIKETYYDGNGGLALRTDVNVSGFSYIVGNGLRLKQSYLGIDGNPCYSSNGYAAVRYEYDENGYETKLFLLDIEDSPIFTAFGYAQYTCKNDSKGNRLEVSFLDTENQLIERKDGYAKCVMEYDSLGNQTSIFYYDTKDSLCITTDGYAGTRFVYNEQNRIVQLTNYGTENQPVESNYGTIVMKLKYNVQGNEVERTYYQEDGQTLKLNKEGFAIKKTEYDDNGNEILIAFFDIDGNLTAGKLGYAQVESVYDKESGFLIEEKNLDKNSNLVYVYSDAFAGAKYKRDNRGNLTEYYPYGTDKQLVPGRYIICYEYDNHDNCIAMEYYDRNRNKTLNKGYFRMVHVFNDRHQIIEEKYYDKNNNLVISSDGFAVGKCEYDNRGNRTEYAVFDASEKPVFVTFRDGYGNITDRYARMKIEYDAMNREVKYLYFDEKEQFTNPTVQAPEKIYGYDKWGNKNYFAYADGEGNLINHAKYYYAYHSSEYDIKGNLLSQAYYDKDGKPYNSDGFYKITCSYNKEGHNIETRYWDASDNLRKNSYAIIRYKYDERGNMTEISYFNNLDKPIDNSNVAHKLVISYDDRGNYQYLKRYKANGKLEATLKWNIQRETWELVENNTRVLSTNNSRSSSDWRETWKAMAAECPAQVNDQVEILSVSLLSNGCMITIRFIEISKYDISNSDLDKKKSEARSLAQYLKKESNMPSGTTLTFVCLDKAKRELFRLTY